ncbi:hypothetical protein I3256_15020 [Photobacterium damselae]|uniref:hypothetical protein n=2 Tax=Vibrionaceae TaxID=641 RepID=UPI001EDF98CE|nr:hypothetical protein [Photobacterium damselae]MCG3817260.1 hypothetical protein [Photobacterium damselae]
MKINQNCPYCMRDAFAISAVNTLTFKVEQQQLMDDGIHPVKCPKGHEFVVVFNGAKFEVLFDIAMNAIKDGYAREAVSSFASALERFYEFFIRYCAYYQETDGNEFEKVWKSVVNQSERQLGAYLFVYLSKYYSAPTLLSQKKVTFRNKVIHKGYIPTLSEAIEFGEAVHRSIMNVIAKLEVDEDKQLSEFYQTMLPHASGFEWTVNESPRAISLNTRYKTPELSKPTRCKEYAVILKAFGVASNL